MNYMAAAMAPAEARYSEEVVRSTFGHRAPKKNTTYRGTVVVAWGEYDSGDINPTVVQDNMGVDDSPWWYDALHDYLGQERGTPGTVKELSLTWRNYRFWLTGSRTLLEPND